ncbi:GcrA family cell cycle regulator [Paracoccus sp. (in: a-proteobacteria)]|uniref:GcrA family cell cycle regulator n=1 Tax=Paracoccus sp. TaxID=267 RepID=UPI002AFF8201|nr:GcrA family cell cycle regulator [Paracoccus sp. (in: a-proteobacteria)]
MGRGPVCQSDRQGAGRRDPQRGDRQGSPAGPVESQRRGGGSRPGTRGKTRRRRAGARAKAGTRAGARAEAQTRCRSRPGTDPRARAASGHLQPPTHRSGGPASAAAALGQRDQPRGAGLGARGQKRARKLTLMELTERTCKWPIGDPATDKFWFCGLPSVPGKPYCEAHVGVAFQPMSSRRDRRR